MPTSTPSLCWECPPSLQGSQVGPEPSSCSHPTTALSSAHPITWLAPTSGYVPPTPYLGFKAAPQARRKGQGKPPVPAT